LQHVVVRLGPIGPAADTPEVDDIADQIENVGLGVLEEVEQGIGLRGPGAEMHVGQENGAIADRVGLRRHAVKSPAGFLLHAGAKPDSCYRVVTKTCLCTAGRRRSGCPRAAAY
jgi:hypothetical protein